MCRPWCFLKFCFFKKWEEEKVGGSDEGSDEGSEEGGDCTGQLSGRRATEACWYTSQTDEVGEIQVDLANRLLTNYKLIVEKQLSRLGPAARP